MTKSEVRGGSFGPLLMLREGAGCSAILNGPARLRSSQSSSGMAYRLPQTERRSERKLAFAEEHGMSSKLDMAWCYTALEHTASPRGLEGTDIGFPELR